MYDYFYALFVYNVWKQRIHSLSMELYLNLFKFIYIKTIAQIVWLK